jgi:hypothetical protein
MTATSDEEFLAAFERLEIPKEDFHHRDHLRLAWSCLRQAEPPGALDRVRTAICRFAEKHGVPELYHETITRFWVEHLAETMRTFPDAPDFATLADRRPEMLDKDLVRRRYRPETLAGDRARAEWVEPDA